MPIPKILHQTWKTDTVPYEWQRFAESWKRLHPEWEYRLWTDDDNRAFVASRYPNLLPAFDGYRYNIQRADAVRYCLLHYYGGVYADLDIECLAAMDELIEGHDFVAVMEPEAQSLFFGKSRMISNAFMASRPEHPLLKAVIDRLIQDRGKGLTHRDVLESTGPLMLDAVAQTYEGKDVCLLPSEVVFPLPAHTEALRQLRDNGSAEQRAALVRRGTYAVHYWANSWVGTLAGELINPAPYRIEGYDFFLGLDSPGNDISNVGREVAKAAEACRDIPGALGFNTDGFVKGRLLPRGEWQAMDHAKPNEGLYVRKRRRPAWLMERLLRVTRRE